MFAVLLSTKAENVFKVLSVFISVIFISVAVEEIRKPQEQDQAKIKLSDKIQNPSITRSRNYAVMNVFEHAHSVH